MSVYSQVVVGTDGSVTAQRAVRRAATIAAGLSSPLLVATAYMRARPEDLGPRSQRAQEPGIEASFGFGYIGAQETAQEGAFVASRAFPSLRVDTITPQGDPADTLLELADDKDDTLLVVGGQGLGAKLLDRALGYAREQSSKAIILETTDGLPESQALYEKLGFRVTSNSNEELWDGERPLICMKLDLT